MWSVGPWTILFKILIPIGFFISLIWNWVHLYMVALAEHKKNIIETAGLHELCIGLKEMTWWDNLREWYRTTWTFQNHPCKLYYETVLVNPILLVPPTKAFIVTITHLFTDPLKHIGQGLNDFLRALLKDLPIFLQIAVFFTIGASFLVFTYGSALGAIQSIVQLPWLPAVVQPQAHQLRDDEDLYPLPQQVHQESNRTNLVRNTVKSGTWAEVVNAYVQQNYQEDNRKPQPRKTSPGNSQGVPV